MSWIVEEVQIANERMYRAFNPDMETIKILFATREEAQKFADKLNEREETK